ncbi:MAG: hypothetical protein HEQ39_01485 [Rhizobacter sp.]
MSLTIHSTSPVGTSATDHLLELDTMDQPREAVRGNPLSVVPVPPHQASNALNTSALGTVPTWTSLFDASRGYKSPTASTKTKPAELLLAGVPKSERKPLNGKDKDGTTFRVGVGKGFPFSPKTGTPHPNTKEPDVHLDMRKIDLQLLRTESIQGRVAAEAAQWAGFPLAGKLLARYFDNTGTPMIVSPNLTGWGQVINSTTDPGNPYDPNNGVLRSLLERHVVQYFRDNPTATSVTASTKWREQQGAPVNSLGRNVDDSFFALGSFYTRMAGEFVAKRDSTGKVVSIDAQIQWLGYDYYDFSRDGKINLTIPKLGTIPREHLWMMAQPQVGLAKGFDVWIPGPVLRVRVDLKNR